MQILEHLIAMDADKPWCSCCPPEPGWTLQEQIGILVRVLQQGKYNTKPGKLRQGCISYTSDHELTEAEIDELDAYSRAHTD
jgi:hypothetical protein